MELNSANNSPHERFYYECQKKIKAWQLKDHVEKLTDISPGENDIEAIGVRACTEETLLLTSQKLVEVLNLPAFEDELERGVAECSHIANS